MGKLTHRGTIPPTDSNEQLVLPNIHSEGRVKQGCFPPRTRNLPFCPHCGSVLVFSACPLGPGSLAAASRLGAKALWMPHHWDAKSSFSGWYSVS